MLEICLGDLLVWVARRRNDWYLLRGGIATTTARVTITVERIHLCVGVHEVKKIRCETLDQRGKNRFFAIGTDVPPLGRAVPTSKEMDL